MPAWSIGRAIRGNFLLT